MLTASRIQIAASVTAAPQRLRLERDPSETGPISSVAVALQSARNAWRVTVHAELVPGRPWRVGEVVVPVPSSAARSSRIVAIATVPGARGWQVEAKPYGTPEDANELGYLEIAAADVGGAGGAPGVAPVAGASLGSSPVRSYLAGVLDAGNTSIVVPATQQILAVSGWQNGSGGTVAILGGSAIPIPLNGSVSYEPQAYGQGAGSVAFGAMPAGGGGYLIELERWP